MPVQQYITKKPIKHRFKLALKLSLLALVMACANTFAQKTVSLNQAISLTLANHPQLKSYGYQAQAAKSLVQQAGVSTPMMINLDVQDTMGTGAYSGMSSLQTTLGISWLLEKDIVDAKIKVANEQTQVSDVSLQIEVLDVAAQTAKVFITLLSQQQQLKLAKQAHIQSNMALGEINKLVEVGKVNVIDQLRAKAALSTIDLMVEDLTHEVEASRAQLAAQWLGDIDFEVTGNLTNMPAINSLNNDIEQLKTNPRLKLFATRQRITQSEIELAKTNQNPAWKIRTGLTRDESVDDFGFSVGISIPFGAQNRNQGKIASLQAQKGEQQALADAWYQRLSTQLLLLTHRLKHNRHVIESLTAQTIPTLNQAVEKAAEAYRTGNYSYTDWHAVQQELLTAQTGLITAYTNIHLNNIELERLTGASTTNQARK
jgi:cobalt-zinc-cadmium efflux system outer membrane protein